MFKKWLVAALAVLVAGTAAASENWTIKNFDVTAAIQPDGSVQITETIAADFSYERAKHGIFRTIPFRYETKDGKHFVTPLKVTSVTDEDGKTRPYKITTEGNEKKIRIGSPNKTVDKTEIYKISYTVDGILMPFEEHDEFYWNVTGDNWPVQIAASSLTVSLPEESSSLQTKCFTGLLGSKEEGCEVVEEDGRSATFKILDIQNAGDQWSVVFGFEKELVLIPERKYEYKFARSPLAWGISVLIGLVPIWLVWWAWKERKKRVDLIAVGHPIIPMYDPPEGLLPAGVGTLRDNRLDARDITAAIVSLAVRGYLKISETKGGLLGLSKDYVLTRTNDSITALETFDAELMNDLFGGSTIVRFSDLKDSFYTSVNELKNIVEKKLKTTGLFVKKNPMPGGIVFVPIGLGISIPFLAPLLAFLEIGWPIFSYIVGGIVTIILVVKFPKKKTVRGAEVAHHIKCYREFLMTAENDRMEWMEQQNIFEKNLPYAIALGVADIWAKRFADVIKIPEWYDGGDDLRMDRFGSRLDDFAHDFHGTAMSVPKNSGSSFSSGSSGFGGGGFSGGGGGGGGGGSW